MRWVLLVSLFLVSCLETQRPGEEALTVDDVVGSYVFDRMTCDGLPFEFVGYNETITVTSAGARILTEAGGCTEDKKDFEFELRQGSMIIRNGTSVCSPTSCSLQFQQKTPDGQTLPANFACQAGTASADTKLIIIPGEIWRDQDGDPPCTFYYVKQ